jgi:hypothetical protein
MIGSLMLDLSDKKFHLQTKPKEKHQIHFQLKFLKVCDYRISTIFSEIFPLEPFVVVFAQSQGLLFFS